MNSAFSTSARFLLNETAVKVVFCLSKRLPISLQKNYLIWSFILFRIAPFSPSMGKLGPEITPIMEALDKLFLLSL